MTLLGRLCSAFTLILALASSAAYAADFKLAGVFGDKMVLQRGCEVPVWGWGQPGAEVSVDFAGQAVSGKVGDDGKWSVKLKPMDASSEGRDMKASSAGREIYMKDVLVGEVWVCSGQSNMQFGLGGASDGPAAVGDKEFSTIRFTNVNNDLSPVRLEDFKTPPAKWKTVSKSSMGAVSAVSFFFAKELQAKLNVPVGLVVSAWSGSKIMTWIPKDSLPASLDDSAKMGEEAKYVQIWNGNDFETAKKLILEDMDQSKLDYVRSWSKQKLYWRILHCFPGWTFNAKISPLKPFAIRGVLWYQGEDDHSFGMKYSDFLTCMASAWSKEWGKELPFFIVMLAPFHYEREGQVPAFWMAQLDAASKIKGSGVSCTVDVGDANDIHPKRKGPVGERLALAALKSLFNDANSSPGPVFSSASFSGSSVSVEFNNAGPGLKSEGDLKGFELAGEDLKFAPAKASVSGASTVAVEAPEGMKPRFVRYAWSNTPQCSLFNGDGLPALPFSTEWIASHSAASPK